ncbi:S-layer homology domain-containing protein [uncultured Oscillibacter sp.]|uniref:S-layer homology domain-containing protein n=1 Tax=uncultured Oscillibacter sp. TaxID=876091 RepID=UPI002604D28B|nr:S-layer homology domain-containing protein [uncultured Oscillibacter sp.]
MVCGRQRQYLPAGGDQATPQPDPTPGTSDDDDDDGYRISTPSRTSGGKVQVRPGSAGQGIKVTITVTPDSGYELDALTVRDAKGNTITLTNEGGGKYSFIIPASRVTVDATFKRTGASTGGFTDVPASHAFYGDISWVAAQGYMGGYSDGSFRPSANTTRQALWMVLARIDGASPSDMAAARDWATQNSVSDGSNPGGAMTRQQMVTMLYRYAQSKGYKTTGGVSLDSFTDASSVADYARDAMNWAVGNGIVQGTGNGTLNPDGTATRAHFAAFLHRFCTSMGIA